MGTRRVSVWPLQRGRIYAADLANVEGQKYFVVVSNNRRNRALDTALAVRVTTTAKPAMASVVELGQKKS